MFNQYAQQLGPELAWIEAVHACRNIPEKCTAEIAAVVSRQREEIDRLLQNNFELSVLNSSPIEDRNIILNYGCDMVSEQRIVSTNHPIIVENKLAEDPEFVAMVWPDECPIWFCGSRYLRVDNTVLIEHNGRFSSVALDEFTCNLLNPHGRNAFLKKIIKHYQRNYK